MAEGARRLAAPIITFLIVVAAWWLFVELAKPPEFLLPGPGRVIARMVEFGPNWPRHIWATIYGTLLGFAVAIGFGVGVAVVVVHSGLIDRAVTPLIVVLQIVPKIALAPLFLVWFGLGITSKVMVAFLVAFFPMVVNTTIGFMEIEPELIDLARSLRMSKYWLMIKIRLPNSLPYFFGGLKVASTLSVIGAIIAEFVGSNVGLGYLIIMANNALDTPLAMGAILIISAFGLVLYGAILFSEKLLMPWHLPEERLRGGGV